VKQYARQLIQAVAVAACIVAAGVAPLIPGSTTELFLAGIGGGAISAAWIFLTSAVGKS
jgi:hypothetical protein